MQNVWIEFITDVVRYGGFRMLNERRICGKRKSLVSLLEPKRMLE